jgi:hypothetical protein
MEYAYPMDLYLIPAATFVVVAAALGVWLWRSTSAARGAGAPAVPARRLLGIGLVIVTAAAAATGAWFATAQYKNRHGYLSIEPAMAELRKTPLIRLLLKDVPNTETLLQLALEEDIRHPVREGQTRAFALLATLRQQYIVPALRSADDRSALAAIATRSAMLRYLQGKSLALCREFAITGLRRVDLLDAQGQKLFGDVLASTEAAYVSGRESKLAARPQLDPAGVRQALVDAGFQPGDFAQLERIADIADVEACALANRINDAPAALKGEAGPALARHLLLTQ